MKGLSILTVSQLNLYIKSVFEGDYRLKEVYIRGEISNYSPHYRSGHAYFTLKDETSAIKAVLFRRYREQLPFEPQDGMRVIIRGQISVYERDGAYQLYAWEIQPDGVGALHLAFEQLKTKLSAEGLFDPARKKPLPRYPDTIGVITSPTGAVIQDICNVISRRYPCVNIRLYPVSVQGTEAAGQIRKALAQANLDKKCDLLILARGGGSLEDLWPFNDEKLARAIAASELPVVSAVGHETDYTIADFAADLRAPTPSAAAELTTPQSEQLTAQLSTIRQYLSMQMEKRLLSEREQLNLLQTSVHHTVLQKLSDQQAKLELLQKSVRENCEKLITTKRHQLEVSAAKLSAIDPMKVLARGYTITTSGKNICRSAANLQEGERIITRFHDGEAISIVEKTIVSLSAVHNGDNT